MAHAAPSNRTVGDALTFSSAQDSKLERVKAAPQKLFEVAVGESAHRNRYKQPSSFENHHKKALASTNGKAFFRKQSFASNEAASRQQHRHLVATHASHTRLSSLADALPHAKPHQRSSVKASRLARRAGGAAHAAAATATWIEDAQRLDILHNIGSDEWGLRAPETRGRNGSLAQLTESISAQHRDTTANSGVSCRSMGASQGGSQSSLMHPASANWAACSPSRSGLFDEALRPINVPWAEPAARRDLADANGTVPPSVRSADGVSPYESLEFAGNTSSGILTDQELKRAAETQRPESDTIVLTGAAGEQCVMMSIPPLPKYLRPRGAHRLPDFHNTAGGGGIGRSRAGGHALLPGRVMSAVLHHEVPLDQGSMPPAEVLGRVHAAATPGTLLANLNAESNDTHKRRQISHMARCMMQSRSLQRLEPDHPRDLTGEYLLAGAWSQQGLHGAPYRPDLDAPSLVGKYSSIGLAEQMALKPRGLNTRSGQAADFEAKARSLSSPGASLIAASGGSMHSTGFDLSPRRLASMSTLDSADEPSLGQVSSVLHSTADHLRENARYSFSRSPSAKNVLLSATSQADIDDFEQRNPSALAQTLNKPQIKAALSVPITQDGRTAAFIFHQRGIKPGKRKADILHAAQQVGIFSALVKVAASFQGPGMEHPFKGLQRSLQRSIRRDLAASSASRAPAQALELTMDTETKRQKSIRRKLENPREQHALRFRRELSKQSSEAAAVFQQVGPPTLDDGTQVKPHQPGYELVRPLNDLTMRVSVPHPQQAYAGQQSPKSHREAPARTQSRGGQAKRGQLQTIPTSRNDADVDIAGDRLRQTRASSANWHRPGSVHRVASDRLAAPDTGEGTFQVREASALSPKQALQLAKRRSSDQGNGFELRVDVHAVGQATGARTLTPRSQSAAYKLFKN